MFFKVLGVLGIAILFSAPCVAKPYQTDPSQLSTEQRALFVEAMSTLDQWVGGVGPLQRGEAMIDSFIQSTPDFLPIYVEKSRLLVMKGFVGNNDVKAFNQQALALLQEVQRKQPNYPKPYVLAGHVYLNLGDIPRAKASLERAQALKTKDPWLYNNFGDLYLRQKQYQACFASGKQGLAAAGSNGKAAAAAIHLMSECARESGGQDAVDMVTAAVFESFPEPKQRLAIAQRLIGAYSGRPVILDYAYRILAGQKAETPDLPEVDLLMVDWLMKSGYRVTESGLSRYDRGASIRAAQILEKLAAAGVLKEMVLERKFDLAMSDENHGLADQLLAQIDAAGYTGPWVVIAKAMRSSSRGDYVAVIKSYEELIKEDPSYANSVLLMYAYERSGRYDILDARYKALVAKRPDSAWTLGNYAGFLLQVGDVDGAIYYGEKALARMPYPIARSTTSLAHLMKASVGYITGDVSAWAKSYKRAAAIGFDEAYVQSNCAKFCVAIHDMLRAEERKKNRVR